MGKARTPGDRRYLWKRGNRWWLQVPVPKSLQEKFGKPVIHRPLGTTDIIEARRLRWPHVHSLKAAFERALSGDDLSSEEVEIFAQREYSRLASMERLETSGGMEESIVHLISELGWQLESGDLNPAVDIDGEVVTPGEPAIEAIEMQTGVTLGADKRQELRGSLIRAQIDALDSILRNRKGETPSLVPIFNRSSSITTKPDLRANPADGSIPFTEVVGLYLKARGSDWTRKTRGQVDTSLRLFGDHMGDGIGLGDITRLNMTTWREKMRRLHPRWASPASSKGLSLDELLAKHGQGPETLSDKTLSRHLSAVHNLFEWAVETGHFTGANPVNVSGSNGGKAVKRHKRGTFNDDDVSRIFAGLKFERQPTEHNHANAMPWVALLGAYSGARLEEVCGLHSSDIKEEDGIWFMDLHETDRQLKGPSAYRRVPLHSEVLAAGFLAYVKNCGDGWLFPSLGEPNGDDRRGTYMGKVFSTHCRSLGIDKPLLGFHYWRKTVATKLENAKVPELEAARLIGHHITTMSYGLYSGGPELAQVQTTVERISYPNLSLSKG